VFGFGDMQKHTWKGGTLELLHLDFVTDLFFLEIWVWYGQIYLLCLLLVTCGL
jgi:hypothetical protein